MIYAFRALAMIADEGIEHVWERHRRLGAMTRDGIAARLAAVRPAGSQVDSSRRSYRLRMSPPESCWRCCAATTASRLRVGKHLADRLIRVGHMGWCTSRRCARQSLHSRRVRSAFRGYRRTRKDRSPYIGAATRVGAGSCLVAY